MLQIRQDQMLELSRATFFGALARRIAAVQGQPVQLTAEDENTLWQALAALDRVGMCSTGPCLVVAHVLWEFGLDGWAAQGVFDEIVNDTTADEETRAEALWVWRTHILQAYGGT